MKHNYDWFESVNEDVSIENNPAMDDNDFEHPTSVGEPTMNEEDQNELNPNEEEDSDEPSFQERVMLIIN